MAEHHAVRSGVGVTRSWHPGARPMTVFRRHQSQNGAAAPSSDIIELVISLEVITVIREAPAMTVRQNLGELLSEVQYRKGKVIITKAGRPVAALVDIALFERIRKLDEEFDRMREELARAFSDMPEKQLEALVDEAVKDARARRRRK